MSFVSYAQNFEDVMLWRALKHVGRGFYLDIGAQDPVIDSVSLTFYEHGWRGVHVEPSTLYAEKIRRARPDETLIQAAVGSKGSVLRFFEILDTGLSTGDPQLAEKYRVAGFSVREIDVPCLTLASILDQYSDHEIHWLKIDVEGMELKVLQGWPPSLVRPWVVVIESTMPLTQEETHDKWEPLLLELGYDFVYFDGLNRFYLSEIHPELKDAFRSSPNVFDGFVLSGTSSAPFAALLTSKLDAQREDTQRLSHTLAEREQALGETHAQLQHAREEWERRAQAFAQHEQELTMQLDRSREDTQRLSHTLAEREQEIERLTQVIHEQNVWGQGALARIRAIDAELSAVYRSYSWRITSPFRVVSIVVRRLTTSPQTLLRRIVRQVSLVIQVIAPRAHTRVSQINILHRIYVRVITPPVSQGKVPNISAREPTCEQPASTHATAITVPAPRLEIRTQDALLHAMRAWRLGERVDN